MSLRTRLERLEKRNPIEPHELPQTIMLVAPGGEAQAAWNLTGGRYLQTSRGVDESEVSFRKRCASLLYEQAERNTLR